MTAARSEALRRLEDLLAGRVRVPAEALDRLLAALIQRAGPEGLQAVGLHLVREPDPRRAALLIDSLPPSLVEPLIPYLVEGVVKSPTLPRGLATVRALGGLGSPAAHRALTDIEAKVPHPALRAAAAARRAEIETAHPARYVWLPRLVAGGEVEAAEEIRRGLREAPDPDLETLLLAVWPQLEGPARQVALDVLAERGTEVSYRALREAWRPEARDGGAILGALAGIVGRHPALAQADRAFWARALEGALDDPAVGGALAALACAGTQPPDARLLGRMLASSVEAVRRRAEECLVRWPAAELAEPLRALLPRVGEAEAVRVLQALEKQDAGRTLEEWASDPDPGRRTAAARAALACGRDDLWGRLLADSDPRVALASASALGEAEPRTLLAIEGALAASPVPLVVKTLCEYLAEHGDASSGDALAGCLVREPWRAAPAARALGRLRQRGVLSWEFLSDGAREAVGRAAADLPLEGPALALWGALIEDLPVEVLQTLRDRLQAATQGETRARPKATLLQAVYLAVVGRLQVLRTAERCREEAEALLAKLETGRIRSDQVGALARCWVRPDVTFPEDLSARVEAFLLGVAEDRHAHVGARVEAVRALGCRGSARCIPALVRLRRNPLTALADTAREALAEVARRNPAAEVVSPAGDEGGPTVLLVEDEASVRDVYARYLLEKGFSPLSAGDGLQALDLVEKLPVDLVVLDLELPRLDGFGVLEALARRRRRPPVVVVTAHGDRATVLRAVRLGADDVVVKPVDLEALVERIGRLLAR